MKYRYKGKIYDDEEDELYDILSEDIDYELVVKKFVELIKKTDPDTVRELFMTDYAYDTVLENIYNELFNSMEKCGTTFVC